MHTQLKKGVLELAILFQIRDEEQYGYEIMKRIRQEFPEVYEGSVYAILRRLAAEGLAAPVLRPSDFGPPRKYYCLTPSGRERLRDSLAEWAALREGLSRLGLP